MLPLLGIYARPGLLGSVCCMRRSGLWVVVAIGAGVGALAVIGSLGSESGEPVAVPGAGPTSSAPRMSSLPGSPIPPSPGEAYKIGGLGNAWLPGIYEAPGGPGCSWVVQRDLVGDASSVLRRGSEPRVGLREGEYFTSSGCGTWVRVGRI